MEIFKNKKNLCKTKFKFKMTIDLTKRTIVTGNQLDELGITKFERFNGCDFSFKHEGVTYSGKKMNGKREKYHILHKRKDKEYRQNL